MLQLVRRALLRPSRGRKKAAGRPRIDWTHPLAKGLLFYGYDTGSGIYDLATGTRGTPQGTQPTARTGPEGAGALWNDNGGSGTGPLVYFNTSARVRAATAAGNYTWACAFRKAGTVGQYTRPFCRTAENAGTSPYLNWNFEINTAGAGQNDIVAQLFGASSGFVNINHWTGWADNQFVTVAASCLFTAPSSLSGVVYGNGVQQGSSSWSDTPGNDTNNDAIIFAGGNASTASGAMVGWVYYGAFWGRVLSAAEHAQLANDPYCFLIFPGDEIYSALKGAVSGAVTGSGAIDAPASDITGTGTATPPTFTGSGNLDAPAPDITGSGTATPPGATGSGSIDAPAADITGSGTAAPPGISGSGNVDAPAPSVTGSGDAEIIGSGGIDAPAADIAGSGTATSPNITGSGQVDAPAPNVTGSGTATAPGATGTGTIDAPAPNVSGSGFAEVIGGGAIDAPAVSASGSGEAGVDPYLAIAARVIAFGDSVPFGGLPDGEEDAPLQQAWEAEAGRVFLYEVTAYKRGTASGWVMPFGTYAFGEIPSEAAITGETVLRFSDLGYTSFPADSLPNVGFDPSILSGLTITRTLPATPEAQRRVNLELGGFQLANSDGELDPVVRSYAVDGRRVRVLLGLQDFGYDRFTPIFTGRILEWDNDGTKVSVTVRDEGYRLDRPLQAAIYGGAGGSDGGADLAGKPKPMAFGKVLNVTATQVDAAHLVYQLHDRAIQAIDAVYDRGAAITSGADYASYAALAAAAVTGGTFATCLAEGLFRLGSTPSGLVTADLRGDSEGGYVDTTQAIARRIITDRAGLDPSELDLAAWNAFEAAQPGSIGWAQGTDDILISDALNRILGACAAWWGATPAGLFQVGQLAAPTPDLYVLDIGEDDIIDLQILPPLPGTFPPRCRQRVGYQQLFTSQASQDLAGSVSAARRQYLSQTSRVVSAVDPSVKSSFLLAADPDPLQSLFADQSDAQDLCDRLLALHGTYRQTVRVVLRLNGIAARLAATARVTHRRLNDGAATALLILDITDNADDRQVELVLWG